MSDFKVLIVDDEEDIVLNLKSIISKALNCTIKTATGFHEAQLILGEFKPTHAFIDINLGDGNGFDILSSLTESPKQDTKIIMMSAYATDAEIASANKSSTFTFIQKPFTKELVMNCIDEIIKPKA